MASSPPSLHDDAVDSWSLRTLFGYANEFKEGDEAISLAAPSELFRQAARARLARLQLKELKGMAFVDDEVTRLLVETAVPGVDGMDDWTVAELKRYLIDWDESKIKRVMPALTSEAIAAVCKLMSNSELTLVANKIYNQQERCSFGARGYFGSRLQPNSPTDDPDEILFSTLEGLSYGCGDVIIGINPVASDHDSIRALHHVLRRVYDAFELKRATTYTVLAHIDDVAAIDDGSGLVQCLFQSIGGNEAVNRTFNIDNGKMARHLSQCHRQYFETGQGSAVTNGVAGGVDMVTLEARAYGLARAYVRQTGNWTIVNDVAGFIGPEVFRTAEQLLRACLEDLMMGKLHGLTMGLDICSTYHMGVSIDEIEHVMDEVMGAGPAYYMAVAGRNDPMLSYITTGYRDHARLRRKHGKRVTPEMAMILMELGVMGPDAKMIDQRAGDTAALYLQLRKREGDLRGDEVIMEEGRARLRELQRRGHDLGYGHDGQFGMPIPIRQSLDKMYNFAKKVIFEPMTAQFISLLNSPIVVESMASNREQFVLKPTLGETIRPRCIDRLEALRQSPAFLGITATIIISDGLNPFSLERPDQATPFIAALRAALPNETFGPEIVLVNGRVRGGYAIGKVIFGDEDCTQVRTVFHLIGERPGNGNNTYSVYTSCVSARQWQDGITHDVVSVVSGISNTALMPEQAARSCSIAQTRIKDKLINNPPSIILDHDKPRARRNSLLKSPTFDMFKTPSFA